MPCPCRAHAVPLPCHAAKELECVFPIWFAQCGRVWFTFAMPCHAMHMPRPCHALTMPFFWRPRHGQSMAWARHGHGMASVNQTRPHRVNQMGKTHSKPLAAWHFQGNCKGAAWARHAMCQSAFNRLVLSAQFLCYAVSCCLDS